MYFFRLLAMSVICCAAFTLTSCGEKKGGSAPPAPQGKIDRAFTLTSQQFRVPQRFLMAIGYLESRLNPTPASALYGNKAIGASIMSSAFGVNINELGLSDEVDQIDLSKQIEAYGDWITKRLQENGVALSKLNPNPRTPDEKFDWLWALSRIHRDPGVSDDTKNYTAMKIFFREVLHTLNDGFTWQSPETGELIKLEKENPSLSIFDFSPHYQKNLEIQFLSSSYAQGATFYRVNPYVKDPINNKPNHIEVIHCPLTLSGCLELQKNSPHREEALLGAHYVIDTFNFDNGINGIMQIRNDAAVVHLTDKNGEVRDVTDALVVMLTGYSGRNIQSVYKSLEPGWFTDEQLNKFGQFMHSLCDHLKNPQNNHSTMPADAKCTDYRDTEYGIRMQFQDANSGIKWGDIPDFGYTEKEHDIFYSYIDNQGSVGNINIDFAGNKTIYQKGDPIKFNVSFGLTIDTVEIERLTRCGGTGQLKWRTIGIKQVRDVKTKEFTEQLFSAGPDGNGTHYFRAKVYSGGYKENVQGFSIAKVHIKDYDKDIAYENCF